MLIQQIDGGILERKIAIAMVTDKSVLARIAPIWDRGLFASRWAGRVGSWCVNYYLKHKDAPNKHILTMAQAWGERFRDRAEVQLVNDFLSSISDEYEANGQSRNSEYSIDLAEKHFRRVELERHRDELSIHLENGDIDKAQALADGFKPVDIGTAACGIDVLRDKEALMRSFEQKSEPLITFSGKLKPLNRFFQSALERDALVGIMAPEKRGKSFCLMELAWRAMLQRRRTAFFACGDMSQAQMERRWAVRASRHPIHSSDSWPTFVNWPKSIVPAGTGHAAVLHDAIAYVSPLDWPIAWAEYQKAIERTKSHETFLRLSCHPSRSTTVRDIAAILQKWEDNDGWLADIVVVDYADILAPTTKTLSPIDKVAEDWDLLRGLSQSRHCLVVTATQVNAASYTARTLTRRNFGGNHLKFASVTGMMGLNQDDEDRRNGVVRYNWIQLREGEFHEGQCWHVAGCLALANPMVMAIPPWDEK